jgi:hypothetical protein
VDLRGRRSVKFVEERRREMARKTVSKAEYLRRIRQKMQQRNQGKRDSHEFRPQKAKKDQTLQYYFRVLPELCKGDECASGTCQYDQELWYYENGAHWENRERIECPRIHDRGDCEACNLGFELMSEHDDKKYRRRIAQKFLSSQGFAVNIYFLNSKKNPEALRGQVMWYNAPKTVWEIWDRVIQSDDPGDEEEPRACGLFFDPYEGGYTFKLEATKKFDFNTYESSSFLVKSLGPLVKLSNGEPDEEAIDRILKQRHVLSEKWGKRDPKKITELVQRLMSKEGGDDTSDINIESMKPTKTEEVVEERTKPAPRREEVEEEEPTKQQEEVIEELEEEKPTRQQEEVIEELEEEKPTKQQEEVIEELEEEKPASKSKQKSSKTKSSKAKSDIEDDDDEALKSLLDTIGEED